MASAKAHNPDAAKPVVLLGAGGHARVLLDLLKLQNRAVHCILDDDTGLHGQPIGPDKIEIAGGMDRITQHTPELIELVNAIGSVRQPTARQAIYSQLVASGYPFATLIHPTATIAVDADLQAGAQVMAQAVIQTGALIQANTIINTGATIDHDTTVGSHTHVAPGATVCGGVSIGACCHIGAGATVVQGVTIGDGSVIGAGATVLRDVSAGQTVVGTPARAI